jgi:hypothetical protein
LPEARRDKKREFLESSAFRSWLRQHNISMLVELHDGYGPDVSLFPWARAQMADPSHLFLDSRFQSDSRPDAPTAKN